MTVTTAQEVFALDASALEGAYCDLREQLQWRYNNEVGPRSARSRRTSISKRRSCGTPAHTAAADREEEQLESEKRDYDEAVHAKFILAVLTGRYDQVIRAGNGPGYSAIEQHQRDIDRALARRRQELQSSDDLS